MLTMKVICRCLCMGTWIEGNTIKGLYKFGYVTTEISDLHCCIWPVRWWYYHSLSVNDQWWLPLRDSGALYWCSDPHMVLLLTAGRSDFVVAIEEQYSPPLACGFCCGIAIVHKLTLTHLFHWERCSILLVWWIICGKIIDDRQRAMHAYHWTLWIVSSKWWFSYAFIVKHR